MKLFISHSQADRAFAERLTTRIQALGEKVWSDERVEPGENWDKTLREALEFLGWYSFGRSRTGNGKG